LIKTHISILESIALYLPINSENIKNTVTLSSIFALIFKSSIYSSDAQVEPGSARRFKFAGWIVVAF
jgi:hypothetical protein